MTRQRDPVTALRNAWTEAGAGRPAASYAARLIGQGWTVDLVRRTGLLAEHACTVGARVAVETLHDHRRSRRVHTRLLNHAQTARDHDASFDDIFGWLAVTAAETDRTRHAWLRSGFAWIDVRQTESGLREQWPTAMAAWSATVGPLAPLAWAAGLKRIEAEQGVASGR